MANFIIQILRSKFAFASNSFFESTLDWNLTKNTAKEVDFVSVFNGKKNEDGDTKATLLIVSDDKEVMFWCAQKQIAYQAPKPSHKVNLLMAFWDGTSYRTMPEEMVDPNSEKIDNTIQSVRESNKDCRVINRYPTINYRVNQKLKALMAKGIIPTLDLAMDNFHKENNKANNIRGMVTWGDEPRAIDPDTGVEFTKEEHDQNRDILKAYDFNASLWKGVYQSLEATK
tara:strand:+ start:535 stop:1218 length:684 start_codon:yes stop_codon:yes gene_type:complete